MDDLRGFLCQCKSGFVGRVCQTELYDNSGERYRKSLLHEENKEKLQFSLKYNITKSGEFMKIPLRNSEDSLTLGVNDNYEIWIDVSNIKMVQPTQMVPNKWHKILITKHNHRLSVNVDHHSEIIKLDESWPMISFSEKPITFTGMSLENFVDRVDTHFFVCYRKLLN